MRRSVGVVALLLAGCQASSGGTVDAVYSVRQVSSYDAQGVASVTCPAGTRVTGGGCDCKGVGDPLFASGPAGNGFVCGCYHFGSDPERGAEASANCLGSSKPGTLSQSLSGDAPVDAELNARVEDLRRRQRR